MHAAGSLCMRAVDQSYMHAHRSDSGETAHKFDARRKKELTVRGEINFENDMTRSV